MRSIHGRQDSTCGWGPLSLSPSGYSVGPVLSVSTSTPLAESKDTRPIIEMQTHQQTTHDMKFAEGLVPLTPPTQKSAVFCAQPPAGEHHTTVVELELELIQTHMAQKPLLWVVVGAHAVRNRSRCAGACVSWRLCRVALGCMCCL